MSMECVSVELPTITEARQARKQLRRGVPIDRVIASFGGVYTADTIAAGIEKMRARSREQHKRDMSTGWRGVVSTTHPVKNIPKEVEDDRDRRALLSHPSERHPFGDPLPGYSAADKTPSIAASIYHDPLDDLIFGRRRKSAAADTLTEEADQLLEGMEG